MSALVRDSEIAKLALPKVSREGIAEILHALLRTGLTLADARAALAANNATPEQLEYLDGQNEVGVWEVIAKQGKET